LQVFLNRARSAAVAPGELPPIAIIPVIWIPALQGLPTALKDIQTHDAAFPGSYSQLGLRQIMRIGSPGDFATIVNTLAHRIVSAAGARGAASVHGYAIWRAENLNGPHATPQTSCVSHSEPLDCQQTRRRRPAISRDDLALPSCRRLLSFQCTLTQSRRCSGAAWNVRKRAG